MRYPHSDLIRMRDPTDPRVHPKEIVSQLQDFGENTRFSLSAEPLMTNAEEYNFDCERRANNPDVIEFDSIGLRFDLRG